MKTRYVVAHGSVMLCGALLFTAITPTAFAQGGLPKSPEAENAIAARYRPYFEHLEAGDALLSQGDADGALREYSQASHISNSPSVHARMGKVMTAKGRYDEAVQQFRVAIADTPLPDVDVALNMALALAKARQYDEAITLYRVGMRLPILPTKAKGALSGTPLTPGYESFRSATGSESSAFDLRFSPSAFDINLFEAAVRTGLGKARYGWPDAMQQFDQAIRLAPGFAPAYLHRGNALKSNGNYAEARVMYEKAATLGQGEIKSAAERALRAY